MIKRCVDVKLNVKPIFILFSHKYYYEGPCRMAGGEALEPGYDDNLNANIVKGVMAGIGHACPDSFAHVMNPGIVTATDDWDIKDEYFETLLEDSDEADAYIVLTLFGADRIWREFCRRCNKPVIVVPNQWNPMKSGYLFNYGVEAYIPYTWAEVTDYVRALRAKKAIHDANMLLLVRFSDNMALAGADDSFRSLEEVTERFGTHFRPVNFHEFVDMMTLPASEEGNPTTPGRITPNLDDADFAEISAKARELTEGADAVDIERKYLENSLRAWRLVNKLMDEYDCSCASIPCPDLCSTRRLNECKFTFCLNHQLNNENGVPSACKYDCSAALTMMAEMCVSGQVPYMANTLPVIMNEDGSHEWVWQVPEEDRSRIADQDNLYVLNMSPMMRRKAIGGECDTYRINHFAYDQKFGAILHKDFSGDEGSKITLARFSGDCEKLLIVRAELVAGYGYELSNCSGGIIFRVADGKRMYKEQARFGLMCPMVFGDCSKELEKVAEVMGLEAVII